jgi:ComF family protein
MVKIESALREIKESFLHLVFPNNCPGCGIAIGKQYAPCMQCVKAMTATGYEQYPGNPVERKLSGRLSVSVATAQYYFAKDTVMQVLLHRVKYGLDKELALWLGQMMGAALKRSNRINADILVPLPLFPDKLHKRGFNQSDLLCDGIAEYLGIPVLKDIIIRPLHTETQTHRGRVERWKNIDGKFVVTDANKIEGKHVLLIDDVITTGATVEACGTALLEANVKLSVACLCVATD